MNRLLRLLVANILLALLMLVLVRLYGKTWNFSWSFALGAFCGGMTYPFVKHAVGFMFKSRKN
jgi:hypothetical protein